MHKTITTEVVVAYAHCQRKAYLLLCTEERGSAHEYVRLLEQQRQATERKYLDILRRNNTDVQPYSADTLTGKHGFLTDARLEVDGLAAECAILSKVRTHSALGRYSYEPTIFVHSHSLKKEQKLALFFVSHVLARVQGKPPATGRIIGLDEKSHKVKLESGSKTLIPLLEPLQEWAAEASPEPPHLILNKHCPMCRFRSLCRAKAEQEDHLSLLDGISTAKALRKYEKKGLFTVKQLSYTFKPKKRKKRAKNPPPVLHKPELQALALREGKIYLQELPQLSRQPLELFLDIEGIPARHFYYLFGLLVSENDTTSYHLFWADTPADEAHMWQQFLDDVKQYPDAPIYHYGSFEPRALAKLAHRYDTDANSLIERLVNVNKHVYGKVYFPVYSNRLKELGAFVGATWTAPEASGLQSLVWRHRWEETRSAEYKELLLTYNQEDCRALKLLIDELSRIKQSGDILSEVDFANPPKRRSTKVGKEVHSQFETILKFAHADYDKKKISLKQSRNRQYTGKKKRGPPKGHQGYQKIIPKARKVIDVSSVKTCSKCGNEVLQETDDIVEQTVIDLVFSKTGVRKTVTKYVGMKSFCPKCKRHHYPSGTYGIGNPVFGHSFRAWVVYQRLFLRLPYRVIVQTLADQFNELISQGTITNFVRTFANYYSDTEQTLIQYILTNPFIHVDETKINIQGVDQYVWVFTDGKHVILKLTETREATIVYKMLSNYEGILISDFYGGYDSVNCAQQKCWSHLIRDLNDDLWKTPFDSEYEIFVLEVRNLILPMLETVEKYGLRKRNLNKFRKAVERFYKQNIFDKTYKSELCVKYQKRFRSYKTSLFTFLEHNDIPWNNNMAERALRHLAIQRKISGTFYESLADKYLLLLSIMQTCRFQDKSFLKFLLSGEKDIDKFKKRKPIKNSKPVT